MPASWLPASPPAGTSHHSSPAHTPSHHMPLPLALGLLLWNLMAQSITEAHRLPAEDPGMDPCCPLAWVRLPPPSPSHFPASSVKTDGAAETGTHCWTPGGLPGPLPHKQHHAAVRKATRCAFPRPSGESLISQVGVSAAWRESRLENSRPLFKEPLDMRERPCCSCGVLV